MKKQMEGDNDQRRAAAADARDEGRSASEDGATTGASKQRRKLGSDAEHEERLRGSAQGKQQPGQFSPEPKPGSTPSRRGADEPPLTQTDGFPPRRVSDHARAGDLDERDERVLQTLARLEDEESAPTVTEIAHEADLDADEAMTVMQRLINDHDLVQELPAGAVGGRRYRIKART